MTNTDSDGAMAVVDDMLAVLLERLGAPTNVLQPIDLKPQKQPPAGAKVFDTSQKERLFCDHNATWTLTAGRDEWIDISLDWVVGTNEAIAEHVWSYHEHTITINGQEIDHLEAYTHDVEHDTVPCPDGTLEIWAKGLSIFLPPLPEGEYEIRWHSEITGRFNNGWVDYRPGNFLEIEAQLTVE
jgi:hypothetical protein